MERLLQRDFRTILDFLREIYAPVTLNEFPDLVIQHLPSLIRCELATYNEMNPGSRISIDRGNPAAVMTPELAGQRWPSVMHEHPVLMHSWETGDTSALRISDFYSLREFRRRALYGEFYRKFSVEDVLCKAIRVSGSVVAGCSFSRDRRSFAGREQLVFDLVGPHLTQAWRNARALSCLRQQVKVSGSQARPANGAAVALGPGGRVGAIAPHAKDILDEFFGTPSMGDRRLPDLLARWVSDRNRQFAASQVPAPLEPLVVFRGASRLVVRLIRDISQDLLLLEVHRTTAAPVGPESPGLTKRETEVMAWVAKGKTNEQIGRILGTSPRTVQKHLEHVFEKLGVETRTAAALRYAALSSPAL